MPTISEIRAQFPALASGFAFLENAGGSQVPACVSGAIRVYMERCYVQLGAGYPASVEATETVERAHRFANRFMNGEGIGTTVLGPSTTQLCTMLAECYSRSLRPGDEIIVCEAAHEANYGPWLKLRRAGVEIREWKVDPEAILQGSGKSGPLEGLSNLLSDRTRLVAFPHVSNLLGEVVDVPAVTGLAHQAGARVVVDGVAYAPHRAIDVRAWDVDFYAYSAYKVFGPHMAAMFGKEEAWAELEGPNHFFLPHDAYKFELGGPSHEACAGLLALQLHLAFLTDTVVGEEALEREAIQRAWQTAQRHEDPLRDRLVSYLASNPRVKVVGPGPDGPDRVGTVSFVHERLSPPEIVAATDAAGIGIRYGHMYAYRLCQALGIDTKTGVVRVSLVHYNTDVEIDRLLSVFNRVL